MPHSFVTDYTLANHRGVPINTSRRSVDAIGLVISWSEARKIDLDERLGSGNLFTSDETSSLAEALWQRRNGTANCSVVGETHGHRIDEAIAYIKWRVGLTTSSLSVNDIRVSNITDRLNAVVEQLRNVKGSSKSIPRGQLTNEQCVTLFEIVRPGSIRNPFSRLLKNPT
ncbi:hypothetical protein, partial [Sphingomonas sp. 37zxx]|uniref:hypothetical protein n=1 Tax=Sphingomonas sp. 37zxx TaxID=1550073 RepID=UPI001E57718B